MSDIRLAIYDRFYSSDAQVEAQHPFWEAVLEDDRHEVVASANNLGDAMLSLVAIKQGEAVIPDIIVVGGRLKDDYRYIQDPLVAPNAVAETPATKRRLFAKSQPQVVSQLLIPTLNRNGEVGLPEVNSRQKAFDLQRAQTRYDSLLTNMKARSLPAMFIVSHVARLYLPEHEIKIIGVSDSSAPNDNVPIDAFMNRDSSHAGRFQEVMAASEHQT